jgi:hypothetical protein
MLLVVAAHHAYSVRLHRTLIQEVGHHRVAIVFDVTAVESGTRGPTGTFGHAPAPTPIDAARR